jgi:hypothetical protein
MRRTVGAFVDLAEGRIRDHHLGHGAHIEALADGERPRRDQLAGMCPRNGGAKYVAARVGHDLDVTNGRPFGLGPVILAIWPAHDANSISLIPRLLIGQSHMGKFRVRKGDPGNCIVPYFDRQTKQRMPDHQPGMVIRHVGEHHAPCGGVPDRVNMAVRGLQAAVHHNAGSCELNSGLL